MESQNLEEGGTVSPQVGLGADTDVSPRPVGARLAAKIADVMGALSRVQKRGYNETQRYSYVTEADVMEAVRSECAARGVSMVASVERIEHVRDVPTRSGGTQRHERVWVNFTFVDSESGESHAVMFPGDGMDGGDKAIYKAITGAAKYCLTKTFLMSTGDDPENDGGKPDNDPKPAVDPKPFGDPPKREPPAVAVAAEVFPDAKPVNAISPEQVQLLQISARKAGHSNGDVKAYLGRELGVSSSKEILQPDFQAVLKRLTDKTPLAGLA